MKNLRSLCFILLAFLTFVNFNAYAETKKFNMVFVPASEKGDENDYKGLIKIVNDLISFDCVRKFFIEVVGPS